MPIEDIVKIILTTKCEHLDLGAVGVSDQDVETICGYLPENFSIKKISLYVNNLSDRSAKAIADFISNNSTSICCDIDLSGNNISYQGVRFIEHALNKVKQFCFVDLSDNPGFLGEKASILVFMPLPETAIMQEDTNNFNTPVIDSENKNGKIKYI